jgi:hypothetical protein
MISARVNIAIKKINVPKSLFLSQILIKTPNIMKMIIIRHSFVELMDGKIYVTNLCASMTINALASIAITVLINAKRNLTSRYLNLKFRRSLILLHRMILIIKQGIVEQKGGLIFVITILVITMKNATIISVTRTTDVPIKIKLNPNQMNLNPNQINLKIRMNHTIQKITLMELGFAERVDGKTYAIMLHASKMKNAIVIIAMILIDAQKDLLIKVSL